MQGKFRFSLDGVDATARQFAEIRRQLGELTAAVESDFMSLGTDCSTKCSVENVGDADVAVPVDALRHVKWRAYWLKDDLNQRLDDAQPVIGLIAEDLDDAGLGFFCSYDSDGNPTGVNYSRLSVAALRLAQEAMDEVDGLKAVVESLSTKVAKMEETCARKSTVGE